MHIVEMLVKNVTALIVSSGVLLVLTLVALRHYSRPRIGYRVYRDPRQDRLWRFLIHNLEPVSEKGAFQILVDASEGLDRVELFAGPYASSEDLKRSELDDQGRLPLTFRGFPAEAVFTLVVKTKKSGGPEPELHVAKESKIRPRGFGPLAPFSRWSQIRYFVPRWVLGVAIGLVSFGIGLSFAGGTVSGFDLVAASMLMVASAFVFALVVPVSGKETVQGYLGWDTPTLVWPVPPTDGPEKAVD